jgi:hypothetical protein
MNGFLSGVKEGFREYGENILLIINSVLLSVVYFIGIGLTSLAAKAAGKRFFDKADKRSKTYWTDLDHGKRQKNGYYRQF